MAHIEEFITKVMLNTEQAKNELEALEKKTKQLKAERDVAFRSGDHKGFKLLSREITKTEKQMRLLRTQTADVGAILKNLSGASIYDLKRAASLLRKEMSGVNRDSSYYKELANQLARVKAEQAAVREEAKLSENVFSRMRITIGSFLGNIASQGLSMMVNKLRENVNEAVQLAQSAEGVRRAFERINQPGLLEELQRATHGTVDDLVLMQNAVKFKDFNLPVEQLGTYLAYAQQKAKDTGQSIDYLVDSIVTGLGRKSPLILDNLGLSAKQISDEAKKSGDFFGAVAKIIKGQMAEAGEYMETSMDRAARAAATLKNKQIEIGRELVPLKEKMDELSTNAQLGALNVIKYLTKHGETVKKITTFVAIFTASYYGLVLAVKAYTIAQNLATTAGKGFMALMKSNWIGLAAAAIAVVVTKVMSYREEAERTRKVVEELNDMEAEATKQYTEQAGKVKALEATMRDERISLERRKQALNDLRAIIPDYNGMLSEEGKLTRDNKKAIDEYLESLEKQIRLKAYQDKLAELYKRQADQQDDREEKSKKYWETHQNNTLSGYDRESFTAKILRGLGMEEENNLKNALDRADADIADTNGKIDVMLKRISDVGEVSTKSSPHHKLEPDPDENKKKKKGKGKDPLKEKEEQIKQANERELTLNVLKYRKGEEDYRTYMEEQRRIIKDGLDKRVKLYKDAQATERHEYLQALKEQSDNENAQREEQLKLSLDAIERDKVAKITAAKTAFYDQSSVVYGNEELLNERLYQIDIEAMQKRLDRLKVMNKVGTEEYNDIVRQIEEKESEHKLQRIERWQQNYQYIRREYDHKTLAEQEAMEIAALDVLGLKKLGKEEEYQKLLLAIKAKYARLGMSEENSEDSSADDAIVTAQDKLGIKKNNRNTRENYIGVGLIGLGGEVAQYGATLLQLKKMREDNLIDEKTYVDAKEKLHRDFYKNLPPMAQAALQEINNFMQGMSAYYEAQANYEQAVANKKYDKLINAAGKNTAKQKKIEEKRQRELAKIKSKYNRKAMKIELAQAIASTALAAINAYSSAAKIPVIGHVMGPIAAALATAAGMLQIATIKKQHAAEEAGYYEGGFTGGSNYRRRAGVVHEGEFVVNHSGVNNTALGPVLQMIDVAQRNNTIGQLSSADVSRQLGQGGAAVVAPVVNVANDNAELKSTLQEVVQVVALLHDSVKNGIPAFYTIDGENGVARGLEKLKKLKNNV